MVRDIMAKLKILWSIRMWSREYIRWRLDTAYPRGWRYAIKHPFQFLVDGWHFLDWCQKIDCELVKESESRC